MTKKTMYFRMIISSLIRRRSRMIIAVLAIAIGATILSGLVTIYYDVPRQLGREFRSYGANLVLLPEGGEKIDKEDFYEARASISETNKIVGMAPYRYHTTKINEQPYILAGTDLEQAKENSPFWYVDGRWIKNDEVDKVMIGKEIAQTLDLKIGDSILVQGVKYGKMAEASDQDKSAQENKSKDVGSQYFDKKLYVEGIITTGGAEEAFIFLNIDALCSLIGDSVRSDIVECSVEANQEELNYISDKIASKSNLLARPVRRVTQSQDIVLSKLQALVYLVTIVVLIITMISVTTTMMAMVAERKKEIGLKKALGAENKLIIKEFLGESLSLGVLGGFIGVFLGFVFAQRVSLSVFGRAINFQWGLIPITIIVSVIVTGLASIWPVRKVLDIHPAIVLRGE